MNVKPELKPNNELLPIDTTSSPNAAKPNVGCCTSLVETPIEQARSRLNNTLNDLINSNATANFKIINALEEVDLMLCKLLKVEKEQIQDAFDNGQANWDAKCQDFKDGKEYFTKFFKN